MDKIVILGSGGHFLSVCAALGGRVDDVVAVASPGSVPPGYCVNAKHIGDEGVLEFPPDEVELICAFNGKPSSRKRCGLIRRFRGKGYAFCTVRHPGACVADRVLVCEGVQILAGVTVQPQSVLGEFAVLNTACSVDHECVVGAYTHVAPGAVLCGGVNVGSCCWIGAGATVIDGVTIGDNVIVGAGAVVLKDIANGGVYAGVPARRIK